MLVKRGFSVLILIMIFNLSMVYDADQAASNSEFCPFKPVPIFGPPTSSAQHAAIRPPIETLFDAVQYHDHEAVAEFIRNGADVNIRVLTVTALMTAAEDGDETVVQTLIDGGAVVDAVDGDGWSALFYAIHSGSVECVDTLINNAANVNLADNGGDKPLDIAYQDGNYDIEELLVAAGATE